MIENRCDITLKDLNITEKKKWYSPKILKLEVNKTKGGENAWNFEWDGYFISSHS